MKKTRKQMTKKEQIEKEIESQKQALEANRQKRNDVSNNLYLQAKEIEKQIEEVEKPFYELEKQINNNLHQSNKDLEEATKKEVLDAFKNKIPQTEEEVEAFFKYVAVDYLKNYSYSGCYEPIRTTTTSNFTIVGIGDFEEKSYIAFDNKTIKVIGTLWVQPSRHPGDYTTSVGYINGGKEWDRHTPAPFGKFKSELENLYRKVKQ